MSTNEYKFKINDKEYTVQILSLENNKAQVLVNGREVTLDISSLPLVPSSNVVVVNPGAKISPTLPIAMNAGSPGFVVDAGQTPNAQTTPAEAGKYKKTARKTTAFAKQVENEKPKIEAKNPVKAPLPGVVLDIKVAVGDSVKVGDVIAIMEAMKMENEIKAHAAGTITQIFVEKGQSLGEGDPLVDIE